MVYIGSIVNVFAGNYLVFLLELLLFIILYSVFDPTRAIYRHLIYKELYPLFNLPKLAEGFYIGVKVILLHLLIRVVYSTYVFPVV